MKTGEVCTFKSEVYKDEVTDREVKRLTETDFNSHHQYFYLNMWTEDSKHLVISSNRDDGTYRHYLVNIESGEGLCLTGDEPLHKHFGELAHNGKSMLYASGRELKKIMLQDMSVKTVYTQEEPWTGRKVYYGATSDHTRAVMMEIHSEDRVEAKEGWDAFPAQFEKKPRCRLVELNVITGEYKVIHEDNCWLGHPNYRPDGRTIMFCHEGPWWLVKSRIWFVDPDGSNLREGKKRAEDRPPGEGTGELWGHEFWLAESSKAAFIYFPKKYGIDATLRLLDPDTLEEEVLMNVGSYSHFIFNRENTLAVGDGEAGLSDDLYMIDLKEKKEMVLCRHGSSMKPYIDQKTGEPNTQECHPHPCFSPDSKRVVFTSDRHGKPAVYIVEV